MKRDWSHYADLHPKDISFDPAVLIEGFPSKYNPGLREAREIRGHLSSDIHRI